MKNFGTTMEFGGSAFETSIQPPDTDPGASNRTFRSTSSAFSIFVSPRGGASVRHAARSRSSDSGLIPDFS